MAIVSLKRVGLARLSFYKGESVIEKEQIRRKMEITWEHDAVGNFWKSKMFTSSRIVTLPATKTEDACIKQIESKLTQTIHELFCPIEEFERMEQD